MKKRALFALVGAVTAGLIAVVVPTAHASSALPSVTRVSSAAAAGQGTIQAQDLPTELVAAAAADTAVLRPGQHRIYFHFRKNHKDPTKSSLTLYRVTARGEGLPPTYTKLGAWRAGSGIGGTGIGQNACALGQGWLPNGWYNAHRDGPAHDTNFNTNVNGGLIFGIVWRLQDTARGCDGIKRTELFIHSEMTPGRKQACRPANYRENQCWDGPADYASNGCIKLKPADIKQAARLARAWGGPRPDQKHYPRLLLVTG
ncbi:hypothetical protein [Phytohabitans houttuyneae]|uniref:YkuD domain-containing protein n=1 Tax=Phytohabitans houttuyneae TaxID=1076126 RepID=A0A6V8KT03_9ACTN|nr:hypothetical protein [Phytohabitans houttuyneae]GFJ84937.1 hypothetical protein Phou_091170 [Phytohabitans houttuyneae]